MTKKKENIFDVNLFKRLFQYIKPYKGMFLWVACFGYFVGNFKNGNTLYY